jgi:hypothetical protein
MLTRGKTMETEENEDDEDSSIISSVNFIKLKTINSKLLTSIFKDSKPSKFRFTTFLKRIHQYSNLNYIASYPGLYVVMGGY